jgi:hypothetical protein
MAPGRYKWDSFDHKPPAGLSPSRTDGKTSLSGQFFSFFPHWLMKNQRLFVIREKSNKIWMLRVRQGILENERKKTIWQLPSNNSYRWDSLKQLFFRRGKSQRLQKVKKSSVFIQTLHGGKDIETKRKMKQQLEQKITI